VIAREESSLRLARLNYLPDFELSVERFVNFKRNDGLGVMAAMSIPIAYKSKYDAGVAEATARLAAAQADGRRLQDRIRREVQEGSWRYRERIWVIGRRMRELVARASLPARRAQRPAATTFSAICSSALLHSCLARRSPPGPRAPPPSRPASRKRPSASTPRN